VRGWHDSNSGFLTAQVLFGHDSWRLNEQTLHMLLQLRQKVAFLHAVRAAAADGFADHRVRNVSRTVLQLGSWVSKIHDLGIVKVPLARRRLLTLLLSSKASTREDGWPITRTLSWYAPTFCETCNGCVVNRIALAHRCAAPWFKAERIPSSVSEKHHELPSAGSGAVSGVGT